MSVYVCTICGYVFDESAGASDIGISAGTKWESLPSDWKCPICSAPKSAFEKKEESVSEPAAESTAEIVKTAGYTAGELSDIFSNLAKGAEKQCLPEEQKLLTRLADYYLSKRSIEQKTDIKGLRNALETDIAGRLKSGMEASVSVSDRGSMRVLTWAKKVSAMDQSILDEYEQKGDAMLKDTKLWVCSICGFVYVGDVPPEICPVCKVPSFKILEMKKEAA